MINFNNNVTEFEQRLAKYSPPYPIAELYQAKTKAHLKTRSALVSALNRKDWDKALRLAQSLTGTPFETPALDATLLTALSYDGSLAFIISLLELGAKLPPNSINLLSYSANVAVATALMNYGLNINYINPAGLNAIEYLVYSNADFVFDIEAQQNMIQFLLNNGVNITPTESNPGLDTLNYALLKVKSSDAAMVFTRFLIYSGAVVTFNHLHQVKQLKINNNTRYNELVRLVPELAVNL